MVRKRKINYFLESKEGFIMAYNLDFLKDDIQTGLLKNIPVGMIRRTLKRINGKDISDFIYLPFKEFRVLMFGGFKDEYC